jgi:hypothetical protein
LRVPVRKRKRLSGNWSQARIGVRFAPDRNPRAYFKSKAGTTAFDDQEQRRTILYAENPIENELNEYARRSHTTTPFLVNDPTTRRAALLKCESGQALRSGYFTPRRLIPAAWRVKERKLSLTPPSCQRSDAERFLI